MLTVNCPLHFSGTSGGNIMTHAYWWQCVTVMWHKKYQWDFKFSRRRVWCSELSSWLYCCVKWLPTDRPWWWRQYAPLKRRSTFILHGSITQKTTLKKYQSDITALSATLWNCWVASNCTVSTSVWRQTERPGFNKVCDSVVNKICVVVMVNKEVMYIIFR
jgi:hypothetical protein